MTFIFTDNSVSLYVTIDPLRPNELPECRYLGPDHGECVDACLDILNGARLHNMVATIIVLINVLWKFSLFMFV